jgi:hypothetical protein
MRRLKALDLLHPQSVSHTDAVQQNQRRIFRLTENMELHVHPHITSRCSRRSLVRREPRERKSALRSIRAGFDESETL